MGLQSEVQQDDNAQPLTSAYDPNSDRIVIPQAASATQDPQSGRWYGPLAVQTSGEPVANQRVNAQSGDFVAGSVVDLATLLALAGAAGDANTVNSFMGRLTKIRDLLAATLAVSGAVSVSNFPAIQRVDAQSGDFPAGSIADLAAQLTLLQGAITGNKMATKAAANDIVDLASLLTKFNAALDGSNFLLTHQKLNGNDIAAGNPMANSDYINAYIAAGQGFFISTDLQTPAAANIAFCFTNPAASGKTIEIYKGNFTWSNSSVNNQVRIESPLRAALANDISSLIGNMNGNSANTSVAKASYSSTSIAVPSAAATSLPFAAIANPTNSNAEILNNNARIILAPNQSLVIYLGNSSTSGKIMVNLWYVEHA